ncbi:hypothetical protein [Lactiplantibacillus pingfangensis]|uniref:hypothetical protein n=1 Tax=Lactiplantibacillus pingfangensis TaxID=2559915 RepID=UPI0010F7A834|nr:hypothetical protein [Lactiplantibacillus pingfangensis]
MNKKLSLAEQKNVAEKVLKKYHQDLGELYDHGTSRELRSVMMYIANEANHKQRVVAGLDK